MTARLLLTEPDPSLAQMYRLVLSSHGYVDVEFASDGNTCLEMLREQPPDILFLDYGSSSRGGDEALARIRQDHALQGVGVVLMAPGHLHPHVLASLESPPVVATLQRPFEPEQLLRVIKSIECKDQKGVVDSDKSESQSEP